MRSSPHIHSVAEERAHADAVLMTTRLVLVACPGAIAAVLLYAALAWGDADHALLTAWTTTATVAFGIGAGFTLAARHDRGLIVRAGPRVWTAMLLVYGGAWGIAPRLLGATIDERQALLAGVFAAAVTAGSIVTYGALPASSRQACCRCGCRTA